MSTSWGDQQAFPSDAVTQHGLTKFEYLAISALKGLLADPHYDRDAAVAAALATAEVMAAELEKREQNS